ncbi:MAG TPA: hypothetical protein VFE58_07910 [Tepidisphaeraceae bacterium]|jgi:hypothetical protein|nr:hypothetical protein [Tepidisphaeraceae bacterium]
MKRTYRLFDLFHSPLHQAWKQDRHLRQRVPIQFGTRSCAGLALLFDGPPADYLHHGLRVLARNDQIRWLALRDIPLGCFPSSPSMQRRPVSWASLCQAEIRHGMPMLDFTQPLRPSWDFRSFPITSMVVSTGLKVRELIEPGPDTLDSERFAREFAVLNALSASMSRFAFFGIDQDNQPVCRPWFRCRPRGHHGRRPYPVHPMEGAAPQPLLAFKLDQVERLFWAGTTVQADRHIIECSTCHNKVDIKSFRRHGTSATEVLDDSGFAARCPFCNRHHRWSLEEMVSAPGRRKFSRVLRDRFTEAATGGLLLQATEPSVYLGTCPMDQDEPAEGQLDLVAHRFLSRIDGRRWTIHLPAGAKVLVHPNQPLESEETWAQALPSLPSEAWQRRPRDLRTRDIASICGGNALLDYLRQLWFTQQGIRLPEDPEHVLFPADLVALACQDLPPSGLYWDLTPCIGGFLMQSEAFLLPPVRITHWDRLLLSLPGDIRVDAGVSDPRFKAYDRAVQTKPKANQANRFLHAHPASAILTPIT